MKKGIFIWALVIVFIVEAVMLIWFVLQGSENEQDAVAVNEIVQSVKEDWGNMTSHVNGTSLDYTVLDSAEKIIYKTREGISESINEAIYHRDTVLYLEDKGGKIIIYNDGAESLRNERNTAALTLAASVLVQIALCAGYMFYLDRIAVRPFKGLKEFAQRVAGGNLDIPLKMDRGNLFGAFTESFDIMRSELKKARLAEAKANASKKELTAKLSHDIRTPAASIKAAAELGAATSEDEKAKESFSRIISKVDQINTLVGNLFTATLEELQQLTVTPSDMPSSELAEMLESADYFHKAAVPDIPNCMIYADKLRLQQVFDNIFANSYKYANTDIDITIVSENGRMAVSIEDKGGGVNEKDLPLLKEKYRRGGGTEGIDGAGLGLYISDRFMSEMKGELLIENGESGLRVTVLILLS